MSGEGWWNLGSPVQFRAQSDQGACVCRQLHHHDRSGFQDSDGGDQWGESEAADLGHGRAGTLPHHHLHVSQAGGDRAMRTLEPLVLGVGRSVWGGS